MRKATQRGTRKRDYSWTGLPAFKRPQTVLPDSDIAVGFSMRRTQTECDKGDKLTVMLPESVMLAADVYVGDTVEGMFSDDFSHFRILKTGSCFDHTCEIGYKISPFLYEDGMTYQDVFGHQPRGSITFNLTYQEIWYEEFHNLFVDAAYIDIVEGICAPVDKLPLGLTAKGKRKANGG